MYSNGVFNDPSCSIGTVDHAVLIVGYTENYYIIKNSWGTWGENGYMRIQRTIGDTSSGLCNILTYGFYVIL